MCALVRPLVHANAMRCDWLWLAGCGAALHEAPECLKFPPGECHKPQARASAERERSPAPAPAAATPPAQALAAAPAPTLESRARGDSAAEERDEETRNKARRGAGKFSHFLRPFTGVVSPANGTPLIYLHESYGTRCEGVSE